MVWCSSDAWLDLLGTWYWFILRAFSRETYPRVFSVGGLLELLLLFLGNIFSFRWTVYIVVMFEMIWIFFVVDFSLWFFCFSHGSILNPRGALSYSFSLWWCFCFCQGSILNWGVNIQEALLPVDFLFVMLECYWHLLSVVVVWPFLLFQSGEGLPGLSCFLQVAWCSISDAWLGWNLVLVHFEGFFLGNISKSLFCRWTVGIRYYFSFWWTFLGKHSFLQVDCA